VSPSALLNVTRTGRNAPHANLHSWEVGARCASVTKLQIRVEIVTPPKSPVVRFFSSTNRPQGAYRRVGPWEAIMHQAQERDEWLMAQVADGKREHLEPLIRRYANPLLTFIRRMVGDQHRSEELFQDVFLAVWVKRRQYQFPRPLRVGCTR